MNRLNKTESAIFISLVCSLLPEDFHSELTYLKLYLKVFSKLQTFYTHGQ